MTNYIDEEGIFFSETSEQHAIVIFWSLRTDG